MTLFANCHFLLLLYKFLVCNSVEIYMLLEFMAYVFPIISLRTLFPRLTWARGRARGNSNYIVSDEMCPS